MLLAELVVGLGVSCVGASVYYSSIVSPPDRIPVGVIELGIGPSQFLNVTSTTFTASIVDNSMSVQFEFTFLSDREYYLYVIMPFVALNATPYVIYGSGFYQGGSNIGRITSAFQCFRDLGSSAANASFTPNATFPWFPRLPLTLGLTMPVERIIARTDGPTDMAILTFFGDMTGEVDKRADPFFAPNAGPSWDHPFLVFVNFPTEAFLSVGTYPAPVEYFVTSRFRSALFSLNFTIPGGGNMRFAQTVSCSFLYPKRQTDIQNRIFGGGLLLGVGVPLAIPNLVQYYFARRKQKEDDRYNKYRH